MAKSVFVTYNFEGAPYTATTSLGLSESLHCNFIQKIETDTLNGKDLNFFFPQNAFPFLNNMTGGTGFGWSAIKINAIVQVVDGTGTTVSASSESWKKIDITDQLVGHTLGSAISQNSLQTTVFKITFAQVNLAPYYDLSYLSIPTSLYSDTNKLGFGEEVFFFGNVKTDIGATVYTTDIAVQLPLGEYNSTTNPTWDGLSSVYVSEVGLFNDNNVLLAAGKFNYPVEKKSSIYRTILFSLDF